MDKLIDTQRKENNFINIVKLIACSMVVTIHCRFPGEAGSVVASLARFAVPFFFAIAGRYFISEGDFDTKKIRVKALQRLKKIIPVTALIWCAYTVYSLIWCLSHGDTFQKWLSMKFNGFELSRLLLFTSGQYLYDYSFSFDHMWFLFALIYIYALVWICAPLFEKLYIPLMLILFGFLFWGEWLQLFYPVKFLGLGISTWYVVRNWLFVGFPFFFLGVLVSVVIHKNNKGNRYNVVTNKTILWSLLIIGIILCVAENRLLGSVEVHIGSLIMVMAILFLAEKYSAVDESFFSKAGAKASSGVYYWHVMVLSLFNTFLYTFESIYIYQVVKPLLVIIATFAIVYAFEPLARK